MGYHPYYTNTVAAVVCPPEDDEEFERLFEIQDQLNREFSKSGVKCRLEFILQNNGDSRIDGPEALIMFDDYTKCTMHNISGDTSGFPTDEEVSKCREVCEKHEIRWSEPKRTERSYIE